MTRFNYPCAFACKIDSGDDDSIDLDDTHDGVIIDDEEDLLDAHGGVTGAGYELLASMDARGEFV